MDERAMRDAQEPDKNIVELRALLASYEERLSRTSDRTPESHAARAHIEPVFLINDLAVDLRSSALENSLVVDSPSIVDCFKPDEPEPITCVHKVKNGVFRVHPRHGRLSAAVIGPFSGRAPSGVVATVQTTHASAPSVRFHISVWSGEIDSGTIEAKLGGAGQQARFLTVPPRHPGFLISTDEPGSDRAAASTPAWSLVLATIADPAEETAFAWADFSDIVLVFPTDTGSEVRLLA